MTIDEVRNAVIELGGHYPFDMGEFDPSVVFTHSLLLF